MKLRQGIVWAGLGGLVLAFAGLSIVYGGRIAWADASALHARWLVSEWRDGHGPAFSPALWRQVRDELRQSLLMAPGNAAVHDDLGFLYASRATALGAPEPGSAVQTYQQQLLDEAINSYRSSTALRPTFPYAWAYLALAKHLRAQHDAEFWHAFDKGLTYGHSEAGVQPTLALVAFAQWQTLGPERQQRITHMVDTAHPQAQARLLELAAQYQVALH